MSSKKQIAILNATEKDIERFWSKVDKGEGTLTECWEWLGTKIVEGYGTFSIKNIEVKCHRLSFFLHTSILDDNLLNFFSFTKLYEKFLLKAKALFPGMVHGVVVQIKIFVFSIFLIFRFVLSIGNKT